MKRTVWSSGGKQAAHGGRESTGAATEKGSQGTEETLTQGGRNGLSDRGRLRGFPGSSVVRNPPANADDTGSIPGLERCHRAAKPVHHNDWACALEPGSPNYQSLGTPESMLSSKRRHRNEKPEHSN